MPDNPSIQSKLVRRVAELYGVDSTVDTDIATIALDFLDEAVKEMNSHLYEFNRVSVTGTALVSDQRDYDLSATSPQIYKELATYFVSTTNTNSRKTPMTYLPWEDFLRQTQGDVPLQNGEPVLYSYRNMPDTTVVSLYPRPDASFASAYTMTTEYYRRIALISSTATNAAIDVPQELETCLMYAAWKRMAIHIKGASHSDVAAFEQLEMKALDKLRDIDRQHPDSIHRFRVWGMHSSTPLTRDRGVQYIKVR
jgi:hypothetical protein